MFYELLSYPYKLFTVFKKSLNKSVILKIDIVSATAYLYSKGTRVHSLYSFSEILFDKAILSSLSSKDASIIGFHYGLSRCSSKGLNERFEFSLFNTDDANYNLVSIDRKKNIIFSYIIGTKIATRQMSPNDILDSKHIIDGFHPIQACYIGYLGGIENLKKVKCL